MKQFFFISFFCPLLLLAQQSVKVNIHFDGKPINREETYVSSKGDSIQFKNIRFYLSAFQLYEDGQTVYTEDYSYHLVDLHDTASMTFQLKAAPQISFDAISFALGVDSLASVSGAMEGALDPTNGMYWAWQSGYINLKIEGTSPQAQSRKNRFQFHLGGYLPGELALQEMHRDIKEKNGLINIDFDLGLFFEQLSLAETHSVMIPGAEAVEFSKIAAHCFQLE